MSKVYLAGKMTGDCDFQGKFLEAAAELRKAGYLPMHSALLPQGFEHQEYIHICKAMIDICDVICLLPDWADSPGAIMEYQYAIQMKKHPMFLSEAIGK